MTRRSIEWRERGQDFYSDLSGRFDLFFAAAHQWWVCVDWESGTAERGERGACEAWAAELMFEVGRLRGGVERG
jgi:hypothetical protein